MERIVTADGKEIFYTLERKSVKNINLRINPQGEVFVSANRRVSKSIIDEFILLKAGFILRARERLKDRPEKKMIQFFTEDEIKSVITGICEEVYPRYNKLGIKKPVIKFRRMVSRWGSCNPQKGILTFNLNLMYAPFECVEYVVWHEFTHFLQANHSAEFYKELSAVCPDWKKLKNKLREINIR